MIISLLLGRYPRPGLASFDSLFSDPRLLTVIWRLRFPRLIMSLLLGASLGGGGLVMQTVLANPLVEPGFLGVSPGAAFGAALAILLLGVNIHIIQLFAVSFALLGLFCSYYMARKIQYGGWILRLILAGIIISALFTSGIGIIKSVADPMNELRDITFWMLGGLSGTGWRDVLTVTPFVLIPVIIMLLFRWRINLLALDDRVAFSLGTNPERLKIILLILSVIAVAVSISISGIVGWIGLIAPHLSRRLFGGDVKNSLPGAVIIGGGGTLFCDTVSRTIFPGELPLGVVTSFIGALLFLLIMTGKRRKKYG